jgi:hypothetical protein
MTKNVLCRAPLSFGRHVNPLVPAVFVVKDCQGLLTSDRGWLQKIIAESLSQQDEKHVVPNPPRWIKVGMMNDDLVAKFHQSQFCS